MRAKVQATRPLERAGIIDSDSLEAPWFLPSLEDASVGQIRKIHHTFGPVAVSEPKSVSILDLYLLQTQHMAFSGSVRGASGPRGLSHPAWTDRLDRSPSHKPTDRLRLVGFVPTGRFPTLDPHRLIRHTSSNGFQTVPP